MASRVVNLRIDCGRNEAQSNAHLFAGLPIRTKTGATADDEERAILLNDEKSKDRRLVDEIPRYVHAVSAVVCLIFLIASIVVVALLYRRMEDTFTTVDRAVNFHASASNMIKNVDSLLNSSATLAATAKQLGIKGLDASLLSAPYLTSMLNHTTGIVKDLHNLAEHPQIHIG